MIMTISDDHVKLPNLPPICRCCGLFKDRFFLSPVQEIVFMNILFAQREPHFILRKRPIERPMLARLVYPGINHNKRTLYKSISVHVCGLTPKLADTGWSISTTTYLATFSAKPKVPAALVA